MTSAGKHLLVKRDAPIRIQPVLRSESWVGIVRATSSQHWVERKKFQSNNCAHNWSSIVFGIMEKTKSVTQLMEQFLTYICHEIAFRLKIHPPEYYHSKRYGQHSVHENRNLQIQNYINDSVEAAGKMLAVGGLESFVFVVTDSETSVPIERYIFHATLFTERSTNTRDLGDKLSDLVAKIGWELGHTTVGNRRERNFKCLVVASSSKSGYMPQNGSWITCGHMELPESRKEIFSLGQVDCGMVDLKVLLHRNAS